MKKTIYLDTTIPSYLFDERENIKTYIEVTKKWWAQERQHFELWISDETLIELNKGNFPRQKELTTDIRNHFSIFCASL